MSRNHDGLARRRWARLRRQIFARDGWRCRSCGRAGRLECDHVLRIQDGGARWDPDNLQTLCRSCHIDKTRGENLKPLSVERRRWREYLESICKIE